MPEQVILEFVGETSSLQAVPKELAKTEEAFKKVDVAARKALDKKLANEAGKEFVKFNNLLGSNKTKVEQLATEYKKLTETIVSGGTKEALDNFTKFGNELIQTSEKSKSLKAQLKELKAELALMEDAGDDTSQKFIEMSVSAARLEDQIGDTNERIRQMASDTRGIDLMVESVRGVTAAFSLAQGASALFGKENEDLQKALLKVQGATAILMGTQELAEIVTRKGGIATTIAAAAQRAWNAAISANPYLIALGVITALVGAITFLVRGTDDATKSQIKLNEALKQELEILEQALRLQKQRTDSKIHDTETTIDLLKAQGKSHEEIRRQEARLDAERVEAALEQNELFANRIDNFQKYKDQYLNAQKDLNTKIGAMEAALATGKSFQVGNKFVFGDDLKKEIESAKGQFENLSKEITLVKGVMQELDDAIVQQTINNLEREKDAKKDAEDARQRVIDNGKAVQDFVQKNFEKQIAIERAGITDTIALLEEKRLLLEAGSEEDLELYRNVIAKKKELAQLDPTLSPEALKLTLSQLEQEYQSYYGKILKAQSDSNKKALADIKANHKLQIALQFDLGKTQEQIDAEFAASGFETFEEFEKKKREEMKITADKQLDELRRVTALKDQAAKEEAENIKLAVETTLQIAQNVSDTIFQIKANQRQADLDAEINKLERQKDKELSNKSLTEAQKDAINKKYQRIEAAAKLKAWKADQDAAATQAGIKMALGIVNAWATSSSWIQALIVTAAVIAAGTASIITIKKQQPPQFATGTPGAQVTPPGFKWVGEKGPELIHTPGGDKIMTHEDSMALMQKYQIPALPDNASFSMPVINDNILQSYHSTSTQIDYKKMAKSFAEELGNNPMLKVNIDRNGIVVRSIQKGRVVEHLNGYYDK